MRRNASEDLDIQKLQKVIFNLMLDVWGEERGVGVWGGCRERRGGSLVAMSAGNIKVYMGVYI